MKNRYLEETETVEDELSRTRKHRQFRQERIKRMIELKVPDVILNHEKFLESLTYSEYQTYLREQKKQDELEKYEYRKNNPPKEDVAKLIWEKFELWFEKYKNNIEVLSNELNTGHCFYEPWFWGSIPHGAEKEFYEHILTEDDYFSENYLPVFQVCSNKIKDRIAILEKDVNA